MQCPFRGVDKYSDGDDYCDEDAYAYYYDYNNGGNYDYDRDDCAC